MRSRGVSVALTLVTAVILAAPSAVAAAITPGIRFMEFNYCGVAPACEADGFYDNTLAGYISAFSPHVVVINEICESQFSALKTDLAGRSGLWAYRGADFVKQEDKVPNGTANGCGGPEPDPRANRAFGNAILTRNTLDLSSKRVKPLDPAEPDRTFKVACYATSVGDSEVPLAACVTKLSAVATNSKQQVKPALEFARSFAGSGRAMFIGGDFNLKLSENPKPSDWFFDLYAYGGGNYEEMDQCVGHAAWSLQFPEECNRETHIQKVSPFEHNKIDYMFFKQSLATNFRALKPVNVGASDHHITLGYADICSGSSNC